MIVSSLEKMEKFVEDVKYLHWDGWTVVSAYPSKKASTSKYGVFVKGVWHLQRRFEVENFGWDIPERFLKD
jgi:hypothetical protein